MTEEKTAYVIVYRQERTKNVGFFLYRVMSKGKIEGM
jgi:hypothetical protein